MKLYYSPGACSLAVHIILNELQIPCEFIKVDLRSKKTEKGDDFLSINPKGAVPCLTLDDGTILTENAVIQQYLADKYQATHLLPPINTIGRYQVLEWLNHISTDLHKTAAPLFNPKLPAETKDFFQGLLKGRLSRINDTLKDNKFLMGDHFTLGDAYLFVVLGWLSHFDLNLKQWPYLSRFSADVKAMPAVQKSLREEGLPVGNACNI